MPSYDPLPNPLRDDPPEMSPGKSGYGRGAVSREREPVAAAPPPEGRRFFGFRFSVASLFAAMFVASIVAAGASYYVRFLRGNETAKFAFTLFTLASPVLVMIVASLVMSLFPRRKRRRR
jgi:hypothetical protein